jgi:hypothetical protein
MGGKGFSLHFSPPLRQNNIELCCFFFSINKILAAACVLLHIHIHLRVFGFFFCALCCYEYSVLSFAPLVDSNRRLPCQANPVLFALCPPEDLMTDPTAGSPQHRRIRALRNFP